jgi:hypothetical protein
VGLPFALKSILRQKKRLMENYDLPKESCARNQNPSKI